MKPLKTKVAVGCSVVCVFLGLAMLTIGWRLFFVQPAQVRYQHPGVVIDLQRLGEYQANLEHLRLAEERTGHVIWEVVASQQIIPVWTIELEPGPNPASPTHWLAPRQLIPPSAREFILKPAVRYQLEIWTNMNERQSHRTLHFSFDFDQ